MLSSCLVISDGCTIWLTSKQYAIASEPSAHLSIARRLRLKEGHTALRHRQKAAPGQRPHRKVSQTSRAGGERRSRRACWPRILGPERKALLSVRTHPPTSDELMGSARRIIRDQTHTTFCIITIHISFHVFLPPFCNAQETLFLNETNQTDTY